jgi:Flp pilus assembly protein TadG
MQDIIVMRETFSDIFRNRDGNALVETAISLPVLITIMTGIIDFGYQFSVANSIQTVSSETARLVAIKRITTAEAPSYAQSRLMQVNGTYQVGASVSQSNVTVTISLPRKDAALIDVLGLLSEGNLTASSTMRIIS